MKTTPLRQRFINELDIRGYAPSSKQNYVMMVRQLADHYRRSPDRISDEEIKVYLLHLIRDKRRSRSTVNVVVSALRFFYQHVLGRPIDQVVAALPRMKASTNRPQVYSHGEIERLLSADILAKGLEQFQRLAEVLDPATHSGFKVLGDVLHGGFTQAGLTDVEGAVFLVLRGGASAGSRITAATSHLDEAAVQEALGLVQELMQSTAQAHPLFFFRNR